MTSGFLIWRNISKHARNMKKSMQIYEKQQKTYEHFFRIFNKAKQFGEEYELIVGAGLLCFQENPSTPFICRHILTSKVEIEMPLLLQESYIKVTPSIENEIKLENDAIIDLIEQFDSANIIEAEKEVINFLKEKNIADDLFDQQYYMMLCNYLLIE